MSQPPHLSRRALARLLLALPLGLSACASLAPTNEERPPIVFVHGNGDSAALWTTTLWRFESNGWPQDRLEALDLPYPLARDDDTVAQAGRSSAADQAQVLAAAVDRVLARTGARQVVLVGNSRGGNAIRNYVQNFGGAAKVSHAILGGTPNHGVRADPAGNPNNEFHGAGPFLSGLNAAKGPNGDEVTPGVRWMTLRSDNNDKFAQPEGRWIGAPGKPTNVSFDGPALKGALNTVLPGRDHREVSYHPEAFARTYAFITGQAPRSTEVAPQPRVQLGRRGRRARPGGAHQPGAGRRHGGGVCRRRQQWRAPGPGAAPQDHRGRWALGAGGGVVLAAAGIRGGRARAGHDARLPQPVPALQPRGAFPPRAPVGRRQGRAVGDQLHPAPRLLRPAARPHRTRRPQPGPGHPARRGRRGGLAAAAGRCGGAAGGWARTSPA